MWDWNSKSPLFWVYVPGLSLAEIFNPKALSSLVILPLLKERALGLKISARDRPGTYTQKRGDLLALDSFNRKRIWASPIYSMWDWNSKSPLFWVYVPGPLSGI
jgi:hypothetical protein